MFSQFTTFLRRVRDRLAAEGIASSYLDGTTRKRPEVIESFRTGDDPVFLISLKAGGVGLTLTEADYVFVLDPWWNPAVEAQAVDRTHRIGQQRQVFVYRLVATDTIEEKVMALKARKAALFSQVIDDDALMSTPLGAERRARAVRRLAPACPLGNRCVFRRRSFTRGYAPKAHLLRDEAAYPAASGARRTPP